MTQMGKKTTAPIPEGRGGVQFSHPEGTNGTRMSSEQHNKTMQAAKQGGHGQLQVQVQ